MKVNHETHLYHCTSVPNLCKILKSSSFYTSFCLEKASYLEQEQEFAFAMVCFADLLDEELEAHLSTFNSDCYLRMSKQWARRFGLSSVIYYDKKTVLPIAFKHLVNSAVEKLQTNGGQMDHELQMVSLMMSFFKQYEGFYWDKQKKTWSERLTMFYTEREWRYLPLVQNKEDYYLCADDFKNDEIRKKKQQELIEHGYTLKFTWDDIEQIGVKGVRNFCSLVSFLKKQLHKSPSEIMRKLKWL